MLVFSSHDKLALDTLRVSMGVARRRGEMEKISGNNQNVIPQNESAQFPQVCL